MSTPAKWTDVYPHGTKEGDEEMAFFIALARSKWEWRSTGSLVRESGLSKERVEEILSKYLQCNPPLIYMSETKEDHWAYWQRVPQLNQTKNSLANADHDKRIKRHANEVYSSQVIIVSDDSPLP